MSLETYITLQEASQQYNLDPQRLTHAVSDGRIRGGRFNGTFVLLDRDARRMAKQQATREELRAKVAHLEGKPIGMREAARKYNLKQQSISRWANAGHIRIIRRGGKGLPTLVDESDVAYTQKLIATRQIGKGKKVFTQEFIPNWF